MNARYAHDEVTRVRTRYADDEMRRAGSLATLGLAFILTGCAGGMSLTGDSAPATPSPANDISGRWVLSAPNAPFCGLNFSAPAQGRISPEGGCPARFFLARRYKLDGDRLTVTDENGDTLGQFTGNAEGFGGTAASGEKLTLNR